MTSALPTNKLFSTSLLCFLLALTLVGCGQELRSLTDDADDTGNTDNDETVAFFSPGDIVVSNGGSDAVLLLDSDGNYKRTLLNLNNNAEAPWGIEYDASVNELYVSIDGADRVVAISMADGSIRNFVTTSLLAGNLRGMAQLINTDFLFVESNNIERFTASGFRVNSGNFPLGGLSNPSNVFALSNGGFGVCAYGTDQVRTYDVDGNMIASRGFDSTAARDPYGCAEMENGRIATAWNGSQDRVEVLSSDLSVVHHFYNDTAVLVDPESITIDNDGNLLVTDGTFHHIVVLDSSAQLLGVKGNSVLNLPRDILVLPE